MMSNMIKVAVAVAAVCVCMAAFREHAEGANNCGQVLTAMQPCNNYLKKGGAVPSECCKGVASLNSAATTPAVKKNFCECLKSEAKSLGVNSQYASTLPQKCKINIGYPISYNINCSNIH